MDDFRRSPRRALMTPHPAHVAPEPGNTPSSQSSNSTPSQPEHLACLRCHHEISTPSPSLSSPTAKSASLSQTDPSSPPTSSLCDSCRLSMGLTQSMFSDILIILDEMDADPRRSYERLKAKLLATIAERTLSYTYPSPSQPQEDSIIQAMDSEDAMFEQHENGHFRPSRAAEEEDYPPALKSFVLRALSSHPSSDNSADDTQAEIKRQVRSAKVDGTLHTTDWATASLPWETKTIIEEEVLAAVFAADEDDEMAEAKERAKYKGGDEMWPAVEEAKRARVRFESPVFEVVYFGSGSGYGDTPSPVGLIHDRQRRGIEEGLAGKLNDDVDDGRKEQEEIKEKDVVYDVAKIVELVEEYEHVERDTFSPRTTKAMRQAGSELEALRS